MYPNFFFSFFSSKCAVLGDSVAVLEKCWGVFSPTPTPQEDIQEVSDERLALNPLAMLLYLACFRSMS